MQNYFLIIFCLAVASILPYNGFCLKPVSAYYPPTKLLVGTIIDIEVGPASTGIAMHLGAGGKLFIAVDSPPQLITLDADLQLISNQELKSINIRTVSDFCITGGFTLIIVDPTTPSLLRTDSRLRPLSSLKFDNDLLDIQPTSITASPAGELYIANSSDNEIWKIDRNGNTLRHSKFNRSVRLFDNKIEYMPTLNHIVFIDYGEIKILNEYGYIIKGNPLKTNVENPSDIVINSSEIWIGGESLECIFTKSRNVVFNFSKKSLTTIGISPISALAAAGDSLLYILSGRGDRLAKAVIVRENAEK